MTANKEIATLGAPSNPLPWYQQPKLRQLYLMMVILFLADSYGLDPGLCCVMQTIGEREQDFVRVEQTQGTIQEGECGLGRARGLMLDL